MTTRSRGRSSRSRASKKPMLWFNNGTDLFALGGNTSFTQPVLSAGTYPDYLLHGLTILRIILRITFSPQNIAEIVNAVAAVYVGSRGTAGLPPNLNADLANYYYFTSLQAPQSPAGIQATVVQADIRSKRRIRGEDTDLFFRVTNNEATPMQVGMEARMLLTPS